MALLSSGVSVLILSIAWAMGASGGTGGNYTRTFLFSVAACSCSSSRKALFMKFTFNVFCNSR
jgi:hypothetical protein